MKRGLPFLVAALLPLPGFAQTPQPAPVLTAGTSNTWNLDWEGVSGRTYFLQHSDNLIEWQYFPLIESGAGQTIGWGFTSSAERFFVRLKYTDAPTSDPDNDDFDVDGLTNWQEVDACHTDPFDGDTDADAMPDGWEITHGLDPTDDADACLDPDEDGVSNALECAIGSSVTKASAEAPATVGLVILTPER